MPNVPPFPGQTRKSLRHCPKLRSSSAAAPEQGPHGTKPRPPVKFLLVDDLEENLLVLEALLRREGLELFTADSGRAALS